MNKLLLYGDIDVNCYFIEHHQQCYIVDPGYEKERIIQYIYDKQLSVQGILLTHGHIDHIGAIDAFDVPIYLHEKEFEIIKDNVKNGFTFYNKAKPYDLSSLHLVPINSATTLPLGDHLIQVIHTPGHTVGSVCYKINDELYSGDTLFKGTVGRWDFPTGDLDTLQKTIVNLINSLPDNTKIYPAHGEISTIGHEKATNHFYLMWKNLI